MKKIFTTLLGASLIFGNLACFADTIKTVGVTTDKAPLESKLLNKQYSAYSVTYVNKGLNPVSINNIRGENLIGDMNKINDACRFSKTDYTMQCLGFVTLGLTSVVNMYVRLNNMSIYFNNNKDAYKDYSEAKKVANALRHKIEYLKKTHNNYYVNAFIGISNLNIRYGTFQYLDNKKTGKNKLVRIPKNRYKQTQEKCFEPWHLHIIIEA